MFDGYDGRNQVIEDFKHDLCVTEHSVHDSQIEAIYDHTKKNLDAFKEKW